MVQVVTGDSQEEVIIFRDRQTDRHFTIIYISSPSSSSSSTSYFSSTSTSHFSSTSTTSRKNALFQQEFLNLSTKTPNPDQPLDLSLKQTGSAVRSSTQGPTHTEQFQNLYLLADVTVNLAKPVNTWQLCGRQTI